MENKATAAANPFQTFKVVAPLVTVAVLLVVANVLGVGGNNKPTNQSMFSSLPFGETVAEIEQQVVPPLQQAGSTVWTVCEQGIDICEKGVESFNHTPDGGNPE